MTADPTQTRHGRGGDRTLPRRRCSEKETVTGRRRKTRLLGGVIPDNKKNKTNTRNTILPRKHYIRLCRRRFERDNKPNLRKKNDTELPPRHLRRPERCTELHKQWRCRNPQPHSTQSATTGAEHTHGGIRSPHFQNSGAAHGSSLTKNSTNHLASSASASSRNITAHLVRRGLPPPAQPPTAPTLAPGTASSDSLLQLSAAENASRSARQASHCPRDRISAPLSVVSCTCVVNKREKKACHTGRENGVSQDATREKRSGGGTV